MEKRNNNLRMAKSKEDIKYGTAQAKQNEEEALRVRYKAGTPLEGGRIAESETVDLFSAARNIPPTTHQQQQPSSDQAAGTGTGTDPSGAPPTAAG